MNTAKQNMINNRNYLNIIPALKIDANIVLIGTPKGTGKTIKFIREGLIQYEKNGLPFVYIRTSAEQIKENFSEEKWINLTNNIGYKLPASWTINGRGFFRNKSTKTSARHSKREIVPIMYLTALNLATNIQSSKFKEVNFFILDEIQNHFQANRENLYDKIINIISTISRNTDKKIYVLFNNVNINDPIFINRFNLSKQILTMKEGQIRKFKRNFPESDQYLKIAYYKPKMPQIWKEENAKSIATKMSYFSDYGKVINSNDFYINWKDLKYIKKLSSFKTILNIEGKKIGFWKIKKNTEENDVWQFSKKFNKTGREWFFFKQDWSTSNLQADISFIHEFKKKMLRKKVEFDNIDTFFLMMEIISSKMIKY